MNTFQLCQCSPRRPQARRDLSDQLATLQFFVFTHVFPAKPLHSFARHSEGNALLKIKFLRHGTFSRNWHLPRNNQDRSQFIMPDKPEEADDKMQMLAEPPIIDPNSLVSRVLRELYDSVEQEAIPDRFLTLLEQLEMAENSARTVETP
nr:NepR family anti-sigma factor [uncultured Gellertiella sp.]